MAQYHGMQGPHEFYKGGAWSGKLRMPLLQSKPARAADHLPVWPVSLLPVSSLGSMSGADVCANSLRFVLCLK
jgi:hypothetical protein